MIWREAKVVLRALVFSSVGVVGVLVAVAVFVLAIAAATLTEIKSRS